MKKTILIFILYFFSNLFADEETLKLKTLINLALERNPTIKSLREKVEAQKFRVNPEKTLPEPMIGFSIKNIGLDRFSFGEEMMSGIGIFESYVKEIKEILMKKLTLPPGYSLQFSGQYEYMERVKKRLLLVVPLTIFIIIILLYLNTGSFTKTFIVLLAVPFSLIGAVWLLYILGYNICIGVWAGIIALLGVDAETGVIMLLYLDLAYNEMKRKGLMRSMNDLKEAIIHGAVKRVRPKMMTVGTTFMGLLPILLSQAHETVADVMKRISAPMVGGIFTSFIMELLVYPAIYFLWKWHKEVKNKFK